MIVIAAAPRFIRQNAGGPGGRAEAALGNDAATYPPSELPATACAGNVLMASPAADDFCREDLTMTIIITAFERSPDGGKGLARDTRVRWALEEVGQAYEVRLVSFRVMKEFVHWVFHPFNKIPTYKKNNLTLFNPSASSI